MARTSRNTVSVSPVTERRTCPLNVRSAIVISETNDVPYSSSISRFPNGGSIETTACGKMTERILR